MNIAHSRPKAVRTAILAYVVLAAGLVGVLQSPGAVAQGERTEIVIGLQNDMTSLNFWNPETNTVWNLYQVGWSFETLFATDPDLVLYPVLADPARQGIGAEDRPGYDILPGGMDVDVFLRTGVTFHDGSPMTADDVVFSFQTKAWSTEQTIITEGLWWDAPRWPHWSGGAAVSHIGVEKIDATTVRFHLAKAFALFFPGTLGGTTIIPKGVWQSHIDPTPPVNISDPGTTITDSADLSIDFAYGAGGEIPATYGTGWFKLDSWTPRAESHISVYTNYWGIGDPTAGHTWRTVNYPFYPEHLRSIKFVIYSSLDVISLALQRGDIDTLIWSLTPGFLSQVRSNPAIGVEQVTDRGFFYLSFNLRRAPWGDPTNTPARTAASLALRRAISMAIDKDYIVNTLMGGFGIKGAQPISIHNSFYVNTSATGQTFDMTAAAALLTSAGITDQNGDGFRDYIDGSPIRATILTPPKDYDPVRADAGIMISNNLKRIGLNIDAAPTSFDTIVSKAFTEVDFDIYILGWLLGDFPELYIKDFFHTSGDVAVNPAGSNSAGYDNPAVDALIDQALITVDTASRVALLKDVQGLVTNDIPWNVLYYRKNLNAFRNDRWEGWVNTPPQIYNFWSLAKIQPAGAVSVPPPTGALTVALTAPERALAGHTVTIDAFVSQNLAPASGATVVLNATFGSDYRVLTATTDVRGKASFSWVVPVIQGNLLLTATATLGTALGTATKLLEITVGPPAPISTLTLSTTRPVIGVGDTTTITARVGDGLGTGVSGATVRVDTTLVFGSVAPASGVTDTTGSLAFTYTAPATAAGFPNQHLTEFLKFTTTVGDTVAVDTQTQSLIVYVENDAAPIWLIADLAATDLVLTLPAESISVDVTITNFAGTPQVGIVVESVLPASESGIANVTVTPTATTNGAGVATFAVSLAPGAVVGNVPIRFRVSGATYEVSDVAGLLITDGLTLGYAALIDIGDRSIASSPAAVETPITATVWDQLGLPATDAGVIFKIGSGPVGLQAQFKWAFDYATGQYLNEGLDLAYFDFGGSFGPSFASSAGEGPGFGADNALGDFELLDYTGVDSCDDTTWPAGFSGIYVVNATGDLSGTIRSVPHKGDSAIQIQAFIGSINPLDRLNLEILACSGDIVTFFGWGVGDSSREGIRNYDFMIDTGLVVRRAPAFALGSVVVGSGGQIFSSEARTQTVNATFYLRDGAPAANAKVFLTRGAGTTARNVLGATGGTIMTDANGRLSVNVTVPLLSLSQAHFFNFLTADERYAYGGRHQLMAGDYLGDYYLNQFLFVVLTKIPMEAIRGYLFVPSAIAFATATVSQTLLSEGGTTTVTVEVTTGTDAPVEGATVWSGPLQNLTDANGIATFTFQVAGLGAIESLVVVRTTDDQVLRAWYGVVVSHPVLRVDSITVAPKPAGQASTISVAVTNLLAVAGPATVVVSVAGNPVVAQVISIGSSASMTVELRYAFPTSGSYTVTSGSQSAAAVVPSAPGTDLGLGIGLMFLGLIIGAVLGIVIVRMRKGPSAGAPKEVGSEGEGPESQEPEAEELESERK